MISVGNILYPTDFSSYSNLAYFHAVALAESHHAKLTIVHVYTSDSAVQPTGKPEKDRAYWRSQLEQIRPLNDRIRVQHVFLEGDPAQEIIRYAANARIDLIVLGTHGRTGKELQLMGSVAEKVLRDAPCSVFVIKMPSAGTRLQQ